MDRRVIIAFIVVVIAVVFAAAILSRDVNAPDVSSTAVKRSAPAAEEPAPAEIRPSRYKQSAPAVEDAKPDLLGHMRGHVVDGRVKPVSGVSLIWEDHDSSIFSSDADGFFTIPRVALTGTLLLTHPRFADTRVEVTDETERDLGRVRMKSLRLRGNVLATGLDVTIEKFNVRISRESEVYGKSAPGGISEEFRRTGGTFDMAINDQRFEEVYVQANGFLPRTVPIGYFTRESDAFVGIVSLTPDEGILGTVEDESGNPIANASVNYNQVHYDAESERATTYTDQNGRFWLGKPRSIIYIGASHEDFAPNYLIYDPNVPRSIIQIVLNEGAIVRGHVTVNGYRAPGQLVKVRYPDDEAFLGIETQTDSQGAFTLNRLPMGECIIKASKSFDIESPSKNVIAQPYTIRRALKISSSRLYNESFEFEFDLGKIELGFKKPPEYLTAAGVVSSCDLASEDGSRIFEPRKMVDPLDLNRIILGPVPAGNWILTARLGARPTSTIVRRAVKVTPDRTTVLNIDTMLNTGSVSGNIQDAREFGVILLEGTYSVDKQMLRRCYTSWHAQNLPGCTGTFYRTSSEVTRSLAIQSSRASHYVIRHLPDGAYTLVAIKLAGDTFDRGYTFIRNELAFMDLAEFQTHHITITNGEPVELDISFETSTPSDAN